MPQIKVTISESEKRELHQSALQHGISVSGLVRRKLFSSPLEINVKGDIEDQNMTDCHLILPASLVHEAYANAQELGMTKSAYFSCVLSQKGKPVVVRFDYLSSIKEVAGLNRAMRDIELLSEMIRQSGQAYPSDLETAIAEIQEMKNSMTAAVNVLDKKCSTLMKKINRDLMSGISFAKGD